MTPQSSPLLSLEEEAKFVAWLTEHQREPATATITPMKNPESEGGAAFQFTLSEEEEMWLRANPDKMDAINQAAGEAAFNAIKKGILQGMLEGIAVGGNEKPISLEPNEHRQDA